MTLRKTAAGLGFAVAATILFTVLTILFIPNRVIFDALNRALAPQGLTLSAGNFGKAFPLGIRGRDWTISSPRGKLLTLEHASIGLRLAPLLAAKIVFALEAGAGSGRIEATASPASGGSFTLDVKDLSLEQVPFFSTVAGARAAGIVDCQARISGARGKETGSIKLAARGVDLKGVRIGETPLPDATYQTVQGMFTVSGGKATIESFTLQGSGLFVRLKGDILPGASVPASPLNLTLELMPNPDFLEKQKLIFLLMTKYLDTPGHYQIPIRGALGKPVME